MTRRRERARDVSSLVTIFWRDIPAQVTGRSDGEKFAVELPPRFQVAIDRAASIAKKEKYDEYIGEWRSESAAFEGALRDAVEAESSRLQQSFTSKRIAVLIANGGYAETPSIAEASADEQGRK